MPFADMSWRMYTLNAFSPAYMLDGPFVFSSGRIGSGPGLPRRKIKNPFASPAAFPPARSVSTRSPVVFAAFVSAGSDGIDGLSAAAGAVVDGTTWRAARRVRGGDALARFDSGRLAARLGAAIVTGPTGVNLLDLHVLWVDAV